MKSISIILFVFLTAGVLYAAPIENLSSSALMPGDSAIFNLDFIDPFGLPLYDITINARVPGQSTDYIDTLDHAPIDPRYLNTYQGSIHFNTPSGTIQYYGRVAADTILTTQSYKNTGNQFPPASNLYAELASDATGDTTPGSAGQWLDLTGAGVTYSDTRLYARLNNVGGGWPTNQGFTTFFIYGVILLNPDTLSLRATALVFANVPILFPAGLYSVNLADTSFQRISDISHQTSGNTLHLACNISDLITDPNFPVWPPNSGHILMLGFTATMPLTGTPSFNDYTFPGSFIPSTGFLNASGNQGPTVSNIAFDMIPNIALNVRCDYFDPDGNLPVIRQLLFDRGVFDMGSFDHSYGDSASFNHALVWPSDGIHVYFFRFSDGFNTFETPMDTINIEPSGVDENTLPVEFTLEQNYPNPFNSKTIISFNLGQPGYVNLTLYDISGAEVAVLANENMPAGSQSITWDSQNNDGHPVSSGLYFYRLSIDGKNGATKEMLLLK
jgi:hypothetical protein